ncbi:S-layer homology domain-containing protein [Paenibacillus sp. GSMTC-2017]|uniref:S-layer homology domain-containing protein n=1 Tax=Paenibacillus sp. GSMTC-2017 TaxID=2794350 RepID=UPI0018D670D4|nr:S-layer homology domain-containing protein [Paenibacillus sp. GSMTC-2017]MBH5316666.1 S-layer homology domain-containing protein [Paenibacillus sp. GSMTC-2017]
MLQQHIGHCRKQMPNRFIYWSTLIVLSLVVVLTSIPTLAHSNTYRDTAGHWASSHIDWALKENIIQGYEDGTFKPNKPINEAEFLAMLMRAYNVAPTISEVQGSDWHKPYYTYAQSLGWPSTFNNERGNFQRGHAALLMASAANGKPFDMKAAIQWLLDEGISKGRTAATVNGFAANESITRAEALTFLYKLKEHSGNLSTTKIIQNQTTLHTIAINDHVEKLLFVLGKPLRIDPSEYDYKWYVYNLDKNNYKQYALFGVLNNKVVALYANTPNHWSNHDGIKLGQSITEAKSKINGEENIKEDATYYAYTKNGIRITLFIDAHMKGQVVGILQQVDGLKKYEFSSLKEEHRIAMEKQLFELVNSERAKRGISLLQTDSLASAAAKAHSEDMMKNNYFNHKNLDKETPFDRMRARGITFSIASENIAAGFANSIFAHYNLLNSTTGHRDTILNGDLQRLGTGVAFGGRYKVYYTQEYYTPLESN